MKTVCIERGTLILSATVWWLLFVLLSTNQFNPFGLLNIIGFVTLSLFPGTLTILALRLRGLPFWGYIGLAVGFSLLELMIVGLLGNTFWPLIGVTRPLDAPVLLEEFSLFIPILLGVVYVRMGNDLLKVTLKFFDNARDRILGLAPALFIVMAVAGAIQLNDGGSDVITMLMLSGMGAYIIALTYYSVKVGEDVIPIALFFVCASLLLMTGMRGWYVTGHDIQTEYKVFELAKNAGIWNIATYRDPYNACMSITILPTIFFNLMKVPDLYIYKFYFQILFALCPGTIYLITRNWANRWVSLFAALYFATFPTFYLDMPFLNRQEIAFVFYGLMLYIIFEKRLKLGIRRILFVLMGIGVILSHYSTNYTVLFTFALAVVLMPIFNKLLRFSQKTSLKNSALTIDNEGQRITFLMITTLILFTFLWTSIITDTGSNTSGVFMQTMSAAIDGFTGDNRSVDVTSLFTFKRPNQQEELKSYVQESITPLIAAAPSGTYYAQSAYDKYPMVT